MVCCCDGRKNILYLIDRVKMNVLVGEGFFIMNVANEMYLINTKDGNIAMQDYVATIILHCRCNGRAPK